MPRFVILEHRGTANYKPGVHWDLMLEEDGVLKTWELTALPDSASAGSEKEPHVATQLPDHRLAYLEYEGPISGGRGEVRQWDAGMYELVERTDTRIVCQLRGRRLLCRLSLERQSADGGWRVTWD